MNPIRNPLPLLLLLLALPAWADKADRDRPVNIEADSVKVDDAKKLAIYEGKVLLTQGSLMISAQRIEIQQDDKGFATGNATGAPAHFREKSEGRDEFVEGWAQRIEYDGRGDKIRLIGQARLKRGIDELRGEVVVYESSAGLFQARGSTPSAGAAPGGRVRAVIRPRETPAEPAPSPIPAPKP